MVYYPQIVSTLTRTHSPAFSASDKEVQTERGEREIISGSRIANPVRISSRVRQRQIIPDRHHQPGSTELAINVADCFFFFFYIGTAV